MTVFRTLWRQVVVGLLLILAVVTVVGCGGKSSNSDASTTLANISGKVTFLRPPLLFDSLGRPTGLATDPATFQTLPGRGLTVRAWQQREEKRPDGSSETIFLVTAATKTNQTGAYTLKVTPGSNYFIEILSHVTGAAGDIRIIADTIDSVVPLPDRPIYVMRKGLDGSSSSLTPATEAKESTVDFSIGLSDRWLVAPEPSTPLAPAALEVGPTGSRVIAIMDSAFGFGAMYGSASTSMPMDFHYKFGLNHSRGSFVEYNTSIFPQSFDPVIGQHHIFASIRGDQSVNDDAFDEGILFPIFAKNIMTSPGSAPLRSGLLENLSPNLALMEGFSDAISANLLKSPYLADTTPLGMTFRDVRDLLGLPKSSLGPYSPIAIRAVSWNVILKSNGLSIPGTPTDWGKINPAATLRFFSPYTPSNEAGVPSDIINIYNQLGRLQVTKGNSEPVDLAVIFTNDVISAILAPFELSWPRPTTPPFLTFLQDWGANPGIDAVSPPHQSFSMSNAIVLDGLYPNVSLGELIYAKFTLSKDTAYTFSLDGADLLPDTAAVEVKINESVYVFSKGSPSIRMVLPGNATTPTVQGVRMRLLSPTTLQPNPIQAALRFDPAP